MRQKQIRTVNGALNRAMQVMSGTEKHGEEIGLKHSATNIISAEREALLEARNVHDRAMTELNERRAALRALIPDCVTFVGLARELLKAHLGRKYSSAWIEVGLNGSLELPRTAPGLKALLQRMSSYFTINPAPQNSEAKITSARAAELHNQICAAENAVNQQLTVVREALAERNKKFRVLCKRLSGVSAELRMLVEPTDARYLAFGLNVPATQSVPEAPTNLMATPFGTDAVAVGWKRSAGADHYRAWLKVRGEKEEAIAVGSPTDLDFTFENLPAAVEVELGISAVNSGGESHKATIVITTPGEKNEAEGERTSRLAEM